MRNYFLRIIGALLLASAGAKLAHLPQAVDDLAAMGIDGGRLIFVAVLEIAGAILVLIPSTRSIGVPVVSAFLGGAIATHLAHGKSIAPPAIFLGIVWLGAWLGHPELLWSFGRGALEGRQPARREP